MQNSIFIPEYIAASKQRCKSSTKLDEFWGFCKKLHKAKKSPVNGLEFESLQYKFETKAQKFEVVMHQHTEFLRHIPIIVPLKNWLEKYASCTACSDEILNCFINLIENQMIPSHDSTGRIWDLELQRQVGHSKIIENIRCSPEWSIPEQEQMVSFYMLFAKHLAVVTFGFVPYERNLSRSPEL